MPRTRTARHEAGIIGRTLRLMLGVLFGWMTFTVVRFEDRTFNLRALAALAAMTTVYTLFHLGIGRYGGRMHRWYGALVAVAPVVLVFAFGGPLGRVASVAYVGVSLVLQAIRGDGGCEVLAIPGTVIGRPTHLKGILFSPIDWVERHLTGPGGLPG